jgi:glycosyltransferase involved in cell wall biosynthesis
MISVIIPCYNAQLWITQAIESVLDQKIHDLEIIVINDGSTDASASIIKQKFPFVQLIETQRGGPSRARNIGTEKSKGGFIQYLDADDLLAPGKLRMQLELLTSSNADVAYGKWQKFTCDKKGKITKKEIVDFNIVDPEVDLFLAEMWAPPAVYLFKRAIVEKVGSWHTELELAEDARFLFDCAMHQAQFVYSNAIMAYYRVHDSLSRSDPKKFVNCCMKNISDGHSYWQFHGGIDKKRKKVLIKAYGYIARAAYQHDRTLFTEVCEILQTLSPGYVPDSPKHLRMVSQLLGYKTAEAIALRFRNTKKFVATLWRHITNRNN